MTGRAGATTRKRSAAYVQQRNATSPTMELRPQVPLRRAASLLAVRLFVLEDQLVDAARWAEYIDAARAFALVVSVLDHTPTPKRCRPRR